MLSAFRCVLLCSSQMGPTVRRPLLPSLGRRHYHPWLAHEAAVAADEQRARSVTLGDLPDFKGPSRLRKETPAGRGSHCPLTLSFAEMTFAKSSAEHEQTAMTCHSRT